jgi:hypothetical protein
MRDRRSGWKKEMQSPYPPVALAVHGGSGDSPLKTDTNTERRLNHALATDNRAMRRVAQATLEQTKPTSHQNVQDDGEIQRMHRNRLGSIRTGWSRTFPANSMCSSGEAVAQAASIALNEFLSKRAATPVMRQRKSVSHHSVAPRRETTHLIH